MNLATLRVEGPDTALEALRLAMPLAVAAQWQRGQKRRNGREHASSGFNADVADAANPAELISSIRSFLVQCKERSIVFSDRGLNAELSVGISVGDDEQFVASVEFSPFDLLALAECGLALSVTAYPSSG